MILVDFTLPKIKRNELDSFGHPQLIYDSTKLNCLVFWWGNSSLRNNPSIYPPMDHTPSYRYLGENDSQNHYYYHILDTTTFSKDKLKVSIPKYIIPSPNNLIISVFYTAIICAPQLRGYNDIS